MEKFPIFDAEWAVWTEGTGDPLLFIHGFPFDHAMYAASASPLSDRFRVILPDLPGFGESAFLGEASQKTMTMADFADGLAILLDRLGVTKTILCGLSMGGYIAMQFARRHPDRLSGLILCDTRPTPDTPESAAGRLKLAETVFLTGTGPLPDRMIPNLLSERTRRESPETTSFLTEMILRQKPAGVAAAARGMARRDDSTEFLSKISVPTLVLCGQDDPLSPPSVMKSMAETIPNADFLILNGAAHLPPLETPALFHEACRRFAIKVYGPTSLS